MSDSAKHAGGCHCGAVRFEVDLDLGKGAGRCNCTMCTKRSATSVIVKPNAFRLLAGEASLSEYTWGVKNAHYFFCKQCGIHVFGRGNIPQIGGEYASVNVNCIDDLDPATLKLHYFDGRHNNWQAGVREQPWPIHS
jgi:hypothetical protein